MPSIVSCPSCQKRLKIGTDKPGGKLRCPSCNTPFVLGSRINSSVSGSPEFQAFELFEEDVVTDTFVIEEVAPSSKFKPLSRSSTPNPTAPPTPSNRAKPSQSKDRPTSDDLDLLEDGPPRTRARAPHMPPPKDEPVLPEKFDLIDDEAAPKSRPAPRRQEPRVTPSHSEKTAASNPAIPVEPVAERKLAAKSSPRLEPKRDSRTPQKPPTPPSPAPSTDFFLPADFDPFAPAPRAAMPDMSLDALDEIPRLREEPDPRTFAHEFEIIDEQVRVASDGVAIVGGISDDEVAGLQAGLHDYEEVGDFDIADRAPRREHRKARAGKQRVNSDKRGRWAVVHWGLTVHLLALALLVFALVIAVLSSLLAIVARAVIGPSLLIILCAGLMALREILVLLGYGLCIPAPTKNMAWLWAVLALAFGFASMFGYLVALIIPPALFVMPLTFISWFFFLIYLRAVGESLKIHYIVDETMNLMKLLGIQIIGTMLMWGGMIALVFVVRPKETADIAGMALLYGVCSLVFGIASLIMAAVIIYKYFYVLMNLREELGWRLES